MQTALVDLDMGLLEPPGLGSYGYGPNFEAMDVGIDGSPAAKRLAKLLGIDWVGIRLGRRINSCIP
jgi:hypothetical protein